jgi:hypothetical protein
MALTKLPKNAIGTGAVKANNIADGTIQNQDVSGSISNDKLANSSFTINGTSVSLGASQSIIPYLDWQAVQVADGSTQVNAEVNKGYFLDTNAGVIEVFLPTSPSRGDVVGLVDYAGTFGTNQLIINTGGINIDSTVGSEFKVTTNNAIVECVYVDSAKGWLVYINQAAGTTPTVTGNEIGGGYDTKTFIAATGGTITTSGDYKIHTFTGDGCFVVSAEGAGSPTQPNSVDYLVVAGGGAGGQDVGGGGGAGGLRIGAVTVPGCAPPAVAPGGLPVTATTYPITVGGGGASAPTPGTTGANGSNSIFSTITSTGGGGGGSYSSPGVTGASGGSGGGGGGVAPSVGGAGNTPPTSPSQGNPGGGASPGGCNAHGGGGGGASAAGSNGINCQGGAGGSGTNVSTIFGTSPQPYYIANVPTAGPTSTGIFAGGGGGGPRGPAFAPGHVSQGGDGGGGDGRENGTETSYAGVANSGGGGGAGPGGASPQVGASGGKGIVIIRYKFQ